MKAYVLAKKVWLSSCGMCGPFPCGRWQRVGLIIAILGPLGEWCPPGMAFFCLWLFSESPVALGEDIAIW